MNILIDNFKKMYVEFSEMDYFDLDDMAEFFAREQLASSSGYIGDEALKRSPFFTRLAASHERKALLTSM